MTGFLFLALILLIVGWVAVSKRKQLTAPPDDTGTDDDDLAGSWIVTSSETRKP